MKCSRHPVVIALRLEVCVRAEWWEAASTLAQLLCELLPDVAENWIAYAYATRFFLGCRDGLEILLNAEKKFSGHCVIQYNIACYLSQLGRFKEAEHYLGQALKSEKKEDKLLLKDSLWDDLDLRPLLNKIGNERLRELCS